MGGHVGTRSRFVSRWELGLANTYVLREEHVFNISVFGTRILQRGAEVGGRPCIPLWL